MKGKDAPGGLDVGGTGGSKGQGDQSRRVRGLTGAWGTETGAAFSLQPQEVTQGFSTGMDGQDLSCLFVF